MEPQSLQQKVEYNITKWQSSDKPLAPLTSDQNEILHLFRDAVKYTFHQQTEQITVRNQYTIDTYEEYIKWMMKVEKEIHQENESCTVLYCKKLSKQYIHLKELFDLLDEVGLVLDELSTNYQKMSTNITSLQATVEDASTQLSKLQNKKQNIQENLKHYNICSVLRDKIRYSSKVNDDFKNILMQIDISLNFFNRHQNFKDSHSFTEKFNKLLLLCLGKIGYNITQMITATTNEISVEDLLNSQVDTLDPMLIYYGKFQNIAWKFSSLMNHIETNIEKHYLYAETLSHCQKVYFKQRSLLITPSLSFALSELTSKHKNQFIILFRSSCSLVLKVCRDELTCFHYFFKNLSIQMDSYLVGLCQQLYDTLRPCLIRINHLEILSQLCMVLTGKLKENIALNQFASIINQLIEDLEERLVFRTNIFFQKDLLQYKPSPGDLAYPEKLQQLNINKDEKKVSNISMQSSVIDLHGMWYPTVKRTLVCLSLLYLCLKKHLFQSLAHEALTTCAKTLDEAAHNISIRKNNLNGRLFQIKHLLILREQISPFNFIKYDSTDTKSEKSSIFSSNTILEFVLGEATALRGSSMDPRKEINKELKLSSEDFVTHATTFLIGTLICWIQQIKNHLKQNASFCNEDFAKASNVADVINVTQKNIKKRIPELKQIMELYLASRETEMILFRLVKNNVLNGFLQMEEILKLGEYSHEDLLLIGCPTNEQVNILICSICLIS